MKENNKHEQRQATASMNKGSAWMTVGTFASRILGLLYIIPWMRWMGDPQTANEANALFDVGYRFYAIFLGISVAGVPSAIAKQIAFYNARQEFQTSRKLYRHAVFLMAAMGVISGLVLYALAPLFAATTPVRHTADAVLTIRSLVPALMVFPLLSIFRGYFQGHQDMRPSAISQIMEQLFRVIYILGSVYLIRQVQGGTLVNAVVHSTLGAFVGALVAIITLGLIYWRHRADYQPTEPDLSRSDISTGHLFKEIITVAIPFIVTGTGIEITQLIDTNTYMPIIRYVGHLSEAQAIDQYGIFMANVNKLITVVVSLGLAISATALPVLSGLYAGEEGITTKIPFPKTSELVQHIYQLFLMVLAPVCIGLAILAGPVYGLVFRPDPLGTTFLRFGCVIAFLLGAYAVHASMLQALGKHRQAILGLVLGLLIKLAWQFPLIQAFATRGAMGATILSFTVVNVFYMLALRRQLQYAVLDLWQAVKPIILSALLMGLVGFGLNALFNVLLSDPNLKGQALQMLVIILTCVWLYGLLLLRFKRLDLLLGDKAEKLREILGL